MKETTDFQAQQQEAMEQDHANQEVFNAEVAGSKGEAYPDDPLYGSGVADVKARRQAMGWYTESDFQPTPPDPISSYTGPRSAAEIRSLEQVRPYVEHQEAMFRERYPRYDELIDKHAARYLKEIDPEELERWVLQEPNFTDKLYQWCLRQERLRSKLPSMEQVDQMTVEQFTEMLDGLRKEPQDEDEEESEAIDRREMKRMNNLATPAEFERALDRLKLRGF
jgi:hypothetical protein